MGCQGNSYAYNSLTFAENEEARPWRPYHVQRGFSPGDSAVTSFQVWGNVWTEGLRESWRRRSRRCSPGWKLLGTVLLLDPLVAHRFVEFGLESAEDLRAWVHEHARIPASLYWEQYTSKNFVREDADLGVEPFATYAKAAPDEMLPIFEPEKIQVVVVGGSSNAQWSAFMGGPLTRGSGTTQPTLRRSLSRPGDTVHVDCTVRRLYSRTLHVSSVLHGRGRIT